MKAVLTFLFVLVVSASAIANTGKVVNEIYNKIESNEQTTTLKMDFLLDNGINVVTHTIKVYITNEKSITRLYKFKNSRIKKALSFNTKRNKAKTA